VTPASAPRRCSTLRRSASALESARFRSTIIASRASAPPARSTRRQVRAERVQSRVSARVDRTRRRRVRRSGICA
jgi:hypothetical protein